MNDTNRNFKKEQKLLENPLISKPEIYTRMGISRGHFHDKLNGNHGARFTDVQKDQIKKILLELLKPLQSLKKRKKNGNPKKKV